MDKVKQFLEVARRHHFWILCGVAAIVGLLVMSMSTGKLAEEAKKRVEEINGKLTAVQGIPPEHPNETFETGMAALTTEARESVRGAWTELYDKQKKEVFVWPPVLGNDFIEDISRVEEGKKAELDLTYRDRYLNTVRDSLAKALPKIVNAEVAQDAQGGGGIAAPMPKFDDKGNPIFEDFKVIWDPTSQQAIYETFTFFESPSTTIVRQAQEELWVYRSLCDVIAKVNETAKGSHDAPITGIQEMSIAYSAHSGASGGGMMGGFGGQTRGVQRNKAPSMGGAGGMEGVGPPMAGPEGGPAATGTPPDPKTRCKGAAAGGNMGQPGIGGVPAAGDPAAPAGNPDDIWKGFRYVDETGKPLASAAEVDASPLEYNLMPFRMRLTMNPKEIDELLIACRNSTLPIEVREVDLLDAGGSTGAPMGGGGGAMFGGGGGRHRGGPDGEFGEGGGGGMRPPMQMPGAGITGMPQQKTVQIEISGVVYLIKKPDLSKLNITPPEGGAPPDGTAPAATPPTVMNFRRRWPIG